MSEQNAIADTEDLMFPSWYRTFSKGPSKIKTSGPNFVRLETEAERISIPQELILLSSAEPTSNLVLDTCTSAYRVAVQEQVTAQRTH